MPTDLAARPGDLQRIVGWRTSNRLSADLAPDALEHALWQRQQDNTDQPSDLAGLIHHSDRGVQYLSIRYTDRLAEVGAIVSVGSVGGSYDTQSMIRCVGVGSLV